jgi:hypothetical protein
MAKRAVEGIQQLINRTAGGKIRAIVTVDQVYAQNQHETLYYKHPRGGRAKYLEAPLFENFPKWIQGFSNRLLRARKDAVDLWGDECGVPLKNSVAKNAPVEFGDLKRSAGLVVKEGTSVVRNEPPAQARLTEAELDAKDYMRHAGQRYR